MLIRGKVKYMNEKKVLQEKEKIEVNRKRLRPERLRKEYDNSACKESKFEDKVKE